MANIRGRIILNSKTAIFFFFFTFLVFYKITELCCTSHNVRYIVFSFVDADGVACPDFFSKCPAFCSNASIIIKRDANKRVYAWRRRRQRRRERSGAPWKYRCNRILVDRKISHGVAHAFLSFSSFGRGQRKVDSHCIVRTRANSRMFETRNDRNGEDRVRRDCHRIIDAYFTAYIARRDYIV